jgi:hypothetical protein
MAPELRLFSGMALTPLLASVLSPIEPDRNQRVHGRYPITLELQYKVLSKGRVERHGFGTTVNISSGGVLFEADEYLEDSRTIELAMNWPFLLDGVVTLKLVMSGRIVRTEAKAIAVQAERHEFRTAGTRAAKARAAASGLTSVPA